MEEKEYRIYRMIFEFNELIDRNISLLTEQEVLIEKRRDNLKLTSHKLEMIIKETVSPLIKFGTLRGYELSLEFSHKIFGKCGSFREIKAGAIEETDPSYALLQKLLAYKQIAEVTIVTHDTVYIKFSTGPQYGNLVEFMRPIAAKLTIDLKELLLDLGYQEPKFGGMYIDF